MRRRGVPRIVRPRVLRVSPAKFLPHFGIRPVPEAPEVAGQLHGPAVGCQERQQDRFVRRSDSRCFCKAAQLLQFRCRGDGAVLSVLEPNVPTTRNSEEDRRVPLEGGRDVSGQSGTEVDVGHAPRTVRLRSGKVLDVDHTPGEADAPQKLQRRLRRGPLEPPRRERLARLRGIGRDGSLSEPQGAVGHEFACASTPFVIEIVLDGCGRRCEPLTLDGAGHSNPAVGM